MKRNKEECRTEIKRVENALKNTNSEYLKRDYKKYLAKLKRELRGD